jgi:ketosteroid isomerase-like protein
MQNIAAKDVERLVKDFHAEDARLLPPNQASVTGRAANAVKLLLNLLHAVQDRSRSAHCSITKEL